jgi:hypothetical protein
MFRKEDSIRRQIRNVVQFTLEDNGDTDAKQTAASAVKIYDLRSTLVHDGTLEFQVLTKATADAKTIVERVLRARFIQVSK